MHLVCLFVIMGLALVKSSLAVQCNQVQNPNPCQLYGNFNDPDYTCIDLPLEPGNILCTCPDGTTERNRPCRICERVNCGPNGVCIEQKFTDPNVYYACGCSNITGNYIVFGPCSATPGPGVCLNGGVYNPATGTCICPSTHTGPQCETLINVGQSCQGVVCANGGVCNLVTTAAGVEAQCWCLNGYSGEFCELIGTPGRCVPGLCQNGGVCEEKQVGISVFAYCRCPAGFSGQCCQSRYFSCPYGGIFADPVNCKFGKYFECVGTALATRSCPKGLRYNFMKMQCDSDVSCPP